jgi:hypothetical protein
MLSSLQKLVSKSESRDSTCQFQPNEPSISLLLKHVYSWIRVHSCAGSVANSLYFAILCYFLKTEGKRQA